MSLKRRLVVVPILVLLISLAGISILSIISLGNTSEEQLQENQSLLVHSMVISTDEFLGKYMDVVGYLRETDIMKDTSEYDEGGVEYRGLSDKQAVELRSLFKNIIEEYPRFAYLETFTADKAVNVVLEPYQSQLGISEEAYTKGFAFRDWYIGAVETNDVYISEAYVSASIMKPVTAVSTPIFNDAGDAEAIFIGAVELSSLSEMVKNLSYGETGITYIIDKNGSLVAHPNDEYFTETTLKDLSETEIGKSVLENKGILDTSQIMVDSLTGDEVYVYYEKLDSTDWYIISQQNVSEAMGSVRFMMIILALVAVVFLLIAVAILFTNANKVVKPLLKLNDISLKVSNNDLRITEDEQAMLDNTSKRSDEIGALSNSLRLMVDNLSTIISELVSATKEVDSSVNNIGESIRMISDSTNEIDVTVQEIAKAAVQQATQTQDGATMTGRLDKKLNENKEKVETLNESFRIIEDSTNNAKTNLDQLKVKNESNNEVAYVLYDNVKLTNDSAKEISSVSNMIASIADQTNLLALNASIEAARAGEAGKGFAVVANEIGTLADESTKSTKQIDDLLKTLQKNSEISVESINKLLETSKEQSEFLNRSEEENENIITALKEEKQIIDGLNQITVEIDGVNGEMMGIITDLSAVAEENAAGSEEASATATQETTMVGEVVEESKNLRAVLEKLLLQVDKFEV